MHSPIRSLFRPLLVLLAASAAFGQPVRFVGKTKFLNNARVAVVHSIDDSTRYVPAAIDAMDKYGIKSTIFVSTENDPVPEDRFFTQLQIRGLWPRLRQAIADGHEIGSHSRQHPCKKPDDESFCDAAYSAYEITGSRDDILRRCRAGVRCRVQRWYDFSRPENRIFGGRHTQISTVIDIVWRRHQRHCYWLHAAST